MIKIIIASYGGLFAWLAGVVACTFIIYPVVTDQINTPVAGVCMILGLVFFGLWFWGVCGFSIDTTKWHKRLVNGKIVTARYHEGAYIDTDMNGMDIRMPGKWEYRPND